MSSVKKMKAGCWRILYQTQFDSPELRALLCDIESAMAHPWKTLKDDPTSTVVAVALPSHRLVIKRANTKHSFQALKRSCLPTRAAKNWHNAFKLLAIGVKTFTPVALIEARWGPFRGQAYFVCTYIEGIRALDYFNQEDKQALWQQGAAKIAALMQHLSANWVSHRDFNLSNILFVNDEPWLIDLDAMKQHRSFFGALGSAQRERSRFLKNCLETPGVSKQLLSLLQTCFAQMC